MSRVKPILFNTDMVRAILDGRKTVTRQAVKPQPQGYFEVNDNPLYIYDMSFGNGRIYPPYQQDDIMYVKETWHKYKKRIGKGKSCYMAEFYGYKASIANSEDSDEKWRPSIHMPKEAVRIWLKVIGVRVERLQDITEKQAKAEGFEPVMSTKDSSFYTPWQGPPVENFKYFWNYTIKKKDLPLYGWNANPWVWVTEFERCEKPEGDMGE